MKHSNLFSSSTKDITHFGTVLIENMAKNMTLGATVQLRLSSCVPDTSLLSLTLVQDDIGCH